jgi:hypothetical protein
VLSKQINSMLGVAVVAVAGLVVFAATASNSDQPSEVIVQEPAAEPQPSTSPAISPEKVDRATAGCLKEQHVGIADIQYASEYMSSDRSPRTPEAAIADGDINAGLREPEGRYTEGVTYAQAGDSIRSKSGAEQRTYVGRRPDGKPRIIYDLLQSSPAGGWVVTSFTVCADPAAASEVRNRGD